MGKLRIPPLPSGSRQTQDKLKLPPLPKQQRQETTWLMEDEEGFLASVPESRMDEWQSSQKQEAPSANLIRQVADDLTRRIYHPKG